MKKPHCGCCAAADWNNRKARAKVGGRLSENGWPGPKRLFERFWGLQDKYSAGFVCFPARKAYLCPRNGFPSRGIKRECRVNRQQFPLLWVPPVEGMKGCDNLSHWWKPGRRRIRDESEDLPCTIESLLLRRKGAPDMPPALCLRAIC